MVEHRWMLLGIACACGVFLFATPFIPLNDLVPFNPDYALFLIAMGAIALQALGVMGMRAYLRSRDVRAPVRISAGFIAALAWGVATLAAIWGTASGPGGVVVGLLLMLPASILALALQIATLIAFRRAERRPSTAPQA
jgi:hypothetical protein